ncbi:unnamed protein product [Closterium sp. Naga37s-1]|nr:unnamed protein product [Closterium sp. Naga37s-1]
MDAMRENLAYLLDQRLYESAEILGSFLVSAAGPGSDVPAISRAENLVLYADALFGRQEFRRALNLYRQAQQLCKVAGHAGGSSRTVPGSPATVAGTVASAGLGTPAQSGGYSAGGVGAGGGGTGGGSGGVGRYGGLGQSGGGSGIGGGGGGGRVGVGGGMSMGCLPMVSGGACVGGAGGGGGGVVGGMGGGGASMVALDTDVGKAEPPSSPPLLPPPPLNLFLSTLFNTYSLLSHSSFSTLPLWRTCPIAFPSSLPLSISPTHATRAPHMPHVPHTCHPCPTHATRAPHMPHVPHTCHTCPTHATRAPHMPHVPHTCHTCPTHATRAPHMLPVPHTCRQVRLRVAECYVALKEVKPALTELEAVPHRLRSLRLNLLLARLYRSSSYDRAALTAYKECLRCVLLLPVN